MQWSPSQSEVNEKLERTKYNAELICQGRRNQGSGRQWAQTPALNMNKKKPFLLEQVMFLACKPALFMQIMQILQKSAEIDNMAFRKLQTFFHN